MKYDTVSINYKKNTVMALTKMSFWKEFVATNLSEGITTGPRRIHTKLGSDFV